MINRRQVIATAAAGIGMGASSRPASDAAALNRLLNQISEALLVEYPDDATFLGLDTGPRAALHGEITDRSIAGDAARAASCAARLRALRAFDGSRLRGLDAINLKAVTYAHELADEGYRRFAYGDNSVLNLWQAESCTPYVVNQGSGWFTTLPDFLDSLHKVETAADAEAYLDRLKAFATGLDGETERMRRDAGLGVVAPDFILDTTLKQMTGFRGRPVDDWGLVDSLARRTGKAAIPGDWKGRAERICAADVGPALDRQIAALKVLRARATSDAGCWKLPDGDAYYRWQLKAGTTATLTPDEVHRLGLEQVKALDDRMHRLLSALGLTQGGVGERMFALSKEPRFLFADSDAGRAELLAYLNGVMARIRPRLPRAFSQRHKSDMVIKRVPSEIETGAPDGYEQDGPIDGSRPATYYINLRDMGNWPRFTLPTLCFHEGVPGHVLQGTYAHQQPPIRNQLMFNAYVEGWALHAEQLADELGMYDGDPFGQLGYLQSIQLRACRLVIDTGLHAKRWTRQQGVDYLVKTNGALVDQAFGEVDRYCSWPGQACGYQVGHLRIEALRSRARRALGRRFDLRAFHDAVLTAGSVPLTLLDEVIDGHIRERGGGSVRRVRRV